MQLLLKALSRLFHEEKQEDPFIPPTHIAGVAALADKYDVTHILDRVVVSWSHSRNDQEVLIQLLTYGVASRNIRICRDAINRFSSATPAMPLPVSWSKERARLVGVEVYWKMVQANQGHMMWTQIALSPSLASIFSED
jgi:hypothetical protein